MAYQGPGLSGINSPIGIVGPGMPMTFSEAEPSLMGGGSYKGLQDFGFGMAISGLLMSAIGSYYAVDAQKYQLEAQSLALEHEATMANINARAAENDAAAILRAGRQEKALATLRYGQAKGQQRASVAARGIQAGVGSAGEVAASIEYAKDVDSYTIDVNAYRAASAARRRAVDYRSQSLLGRTSARNVRRSAQSLRPGMAAATSVLGGAGGVARDYAQGMRLNTFFARGS